MYAYLLFTHASLFVDSITRLSQRVRTVWELQLVFLHLYLEPVLVINDRETNPTRHEFYIRLFICTHAVLFHSTLRDGRAQLGMEGKGHKTNHVQFLIQRCEICHYFGKMKKLKPSRNCCGAHCFIGTRSLKSSRQKKLCRTYPVSVWGNLWGLKQSTPEQQT